MSTNNAVAFESGVEDPQEVEKATTHAAAIAFIEYLSERAE